MSFHDILVKIINKFFKCSPYLEDLSKKKAKR